ncbi:MAG: Ku protein [Candidatus Lokiarchaeota archaeon]|nr:Ku protein [Candidatus Lokiarchaeota archaeon]
MKAVWKGYLGFGLVNIPISLYTAVGKDKFSFRMLHKKDNGPIKYKRVCEKCGSEVEWSDIVKGVEVGKDNYYVLTKKELEELKPKGDDMLKIEEFVNRDEIDIIYKNRSYFVGPTKGAERAYYLLKDTLEKSNKAAIGKFILREKEYIGSIISYKKVLLLNLLHYDKNVRSIDNVPNIDSKIELNKKEKELADELINKLTSKTLDMSKYEETFTKNLMEAIKKKMEGEEVKIKEEKVEEPEDLIEALKASVNK